MTREARPWTVFVLNAALVVAMAVVCAVDPRQHEVAAS